MLSGEKLEKIARLAQETMRDPDAPQSHQDFAIIIQGLVEEIEQLEGELFEMQAGDDL